MNAPGAIKVGYTVERPCPCPQGRSGVQHVVMDFGRSRSLEPIHRFIEQAMGPLTAR